MLIAQGFEVKSYYTLQTGMEGIRAEKPQWVILDNDLPDGRGWDNTDMILDVLPEINIIKISANPDSQRTHDSENIHYLIKPIHVNSITELIRKNRSEPDHVR